jgi:hypothetical protein
VATTDVRTDDSVARISESVAKIAEEWVLISMLVSSAEISVGTVEPCPIL